MTSSEFVYQEFDLDETLICTTYGRKVVNHRFHSCSELRGPPDIARETQTYFCDGCLLHYSVIQAQRSRLNCTLCRDCPECNRLLVIGQQSPELPPIMFAEIGRGCQDFENIYQLSGPFHLQCSFCPWKSQHTYPSLSHLSSEGLINNFRRKTSDELKSDTKLPSNPYFDDLCLAQKFLRQFNSATTGPDPLTTTIMDIIRSPQ